MKIKEPNYSNSIVGIPNSILKHFGGKPINGTLINLDKILEKDYTNIVLIVLDGMGAKALANILPKSSFLNRNVKEVISSTFPSTTVAATTSLDSGLYPSQSGWLGWTQYFSQVDKNVVTFLNKDEEGNDAAEYNVANKFYSYTPVRDLVKENGYESYLISPFGGIQIDNVDDLCTNIKNLCETKEKKYIHAYYPQPDGLMHEFGAASKEVSDEMVNINLKIEELCGELKNTLVIITADHGQLDSSGVCILDYPKIMECLTRLPSIEPRALNLFVKEDKKDEFVNEFNKEFGEKFILYSKEEVIEKKLFGTDGSDKILNELIGDYIAIGTSDLTIFNTYAERDKFIGVHAGLTDAEMEVPLIIIER